MGKLKFFLGEALRSLRRNYFMTIAALVTVFLSMAVLGAVMVFVYNIEAVLKDVEQKVEISVFLKDSVTAEQIETLQAEIVGWEEVKESQFVSKDEALQRLKEDMGEGADVVEDLGRNPLPASFEVSLNDPEEVGSVATRLEGREYIDEVSYGQEIAERIFQVTSVIRNILVVFLVMLGGVSILLISNTIRLSIYARRKEVEIMKLVGATNWFIRWPFVIEGIVVGTVGAAAALAVVQLGTDFVVERIRENLIFLSVPFDAISLVQLAIVLLGVGALIGAAGSGLGLRRFLNV
ncbi:MAG TPA: permease-like cell division protein FtsX [Thermoleophilia bacterium]|nr:permease-like cell division protein FtsX [Thermoleophilia bacterium]